MGRSPTPSRRVYPVPGSFRSALLAAGPVGARVARDGTAGVAALRVLAASDDPELALWACGVCDGIDAPPEVEGLYPAPGPNYGLLDDDDTVVALFRRQGDEDLVRWTGTGWDIVPDQFDPVGAAYVEIPDEELPWFADPFRAGAAGIVLRPTSPRGFLPRSRGSELLGPVVVAAAPGDSSGPTFAIVDDMDTTAVLDLFQVAPGPEVLIRQGGAWVPDPDLLGRLRGVDPPRVVQIRDTEVDGVVGQVDAHDAARGKSAPTPADKSAPTEEPVAAGANPPATTRMPGDLKEYWARGEGAVRIRWGTSGDFGRCQRNLRKYLRPDQVDGACANLHKLATGTWPGKKRRHGVTAGGVENGGGVVIVAVPDGEDPVWAASSEPKPHMTMVWLGDLRDEDQLDAIRAAVADVAARCEPTELPVIGREELGDDRADVLMIVPGFLEDARDQLLKDPSVRAAHDAAEQYPNWTPHLTMGYPDQPANGEPPEAVRFNRLAVWDGDYEGQEYEMQGAQDYDEFDPFEGPPVQLVAAGGPYRPPRTWFDDPRLDGPTPLTVDTDGRVRGHIAAWGVRHIGMPGNVTPPRSRSGYQFFRTGVVETDDGDVPVGQLTLAGGHAPISADAGAAVAHYDNTASAVADLAAGEDRFGIWVAGAVRPGVTDDQIRSLRASAPSGDWRPINGGLELVAVCQVNVPGFPVARARVASGQVLALVAAGAHDMATRRYTQADHLEDRVRVLEGAAKTALRRRVARGH